MTGPPVVGYYAHHQGRGHVQRAECIAERLSGPMTILTSARLGGASVGGASVGGRTSWVELPRDDDEPVQGDPTAGGTLHWAPPRHPGLRSRMATIAAWIGRNAPAVMVVDVSVEVSMLCRLLGVPVVGVAMQGDRTDRAHRLGYDLAEALLACWPAPMTSHAWPQHWIDKTCFVSAFSRFDARISVRAGGTSGSGPRRAALLLGAGGTDVGDGQIAATVAATPDWQWDVLGGGAGTWTADPWSTLCAADVVVTHAGQNALAEVAAARTPAVVIPQDRPHDEQRATATHLERAGLAVVRSRWPAPSAWPALLDEAAAADGSLWSAWCPGDGADRAARFIESVARRYS